MQIKMSTYEAKPSGRAGLFSIVMGIGKEPPMPSKTAAVKNPAEAMKAFEEYVATAKATGKLLACSMRAGDGRKFAGFDAMKAKMPPYAIVNDEVSA
jgi:hypothetical protein